MKNHYPDSLAFHFIFIFIFLIFKGKCFAQAQTCLPNGIKFSSQTEIDAFPGNYPGCTRILGNVSIIKGSLIQNLDGLRPIVSIGGDLNIVENRSLANLYGLAALTSVGGKLNISGNHSLADLQGLEAIQTVGGNVTIDDNNSLLNAGALESLVSVGGRFGVYNSEALENLNGFNKIKTIAGYLDVHNSDALTEINGFQSLETTGGFWILDNDKLRSISGLNRVVSIADNLDIRNNPALQKITGLQKLASVGNHLVLDNNDALTDLSGLNAIRSTGKSLGILGNEKLTDLTGLNGLTVAGGLEIRDNPSLTSLSGLNGLTSLTRLLQLVNNPVLTDLSALTGITLIGGTLQIVDNPSLTTLEGLDNIDYSTIESLTLTGCSNLSYCSVPSICDYLNFGRNAAISGNATGCNSKQEMISANAACSPNFASKTKNLWETEQGRSLLLLLLLTVLAAIGTWLFYRKQQRSRLLQLRTTLAQDLHDDFGSEVSGIALSSFAAARSNDPARMSAALENIAGQSQKLVDDMRDIVWSIHPDNDTLEKMVGRMRQYASKLLDEQDVTLRFEVAHNALPVKMEPEARKQLYLLFKEVVNNLARYARCSEVQVNIRRESGQFVMEIRDNGVGFDPSAATSGNGLRNMRSRAAALNGSLDILSSSGEGTVVCLRAPLS